MHTYELESLPKIAFAHIYSTDNYFAEFSTKIDFLEVTFISEGYLTVEYNGKEYVAQKGDVICLPFDEKKIIRSPSFHEHHTVCAKLKLKAIENNMNGLYLPVVTSSKLNTKVIEEIINQFIHKLFFFKDSPTKGAAKFLELLCEIDSCNRKNEAINIPSEMLYAGRAKEYIHNNIHSPINQNDVAKFLSISPEYLCTIFKKAEGVTLIKYSNIAKLKSIKSLMEKENIHLYEAAALFGYSDPNYVSRLYKKYFGYSITEKPKIVF